MDEEKKRYEQDLESFLADKIAYHKEQAKYHKHQAEELKHKLSILGYGATASTASGKEATVSASIINISGPLAEFRFKDWKPRVLDALESATEPHTTEEIVKRIDERFTRDKNLRRKAIGVVSNAIQFFLREDKITSFPNDEGRGNKYIIKTPQSQMTGGS